MKGILVLTVLLSLVLASCSQAAPTPDPVLLALQTEMAQLKDLNSNQGEDLEKIETQYTLLQSATPQIIVREITQTLTPTPLYTPTITPTPTNTIPPTKTPDPLKAPKGAGFYLVGVDIAPGVWRSDGTGDSCYWAVTSTTGDILDNHFGMAGGTAYISPSGFQVEFTDCGTWTFLQEP